MLISLPRRIAIVGTRPPRATRDSKEWQIYEAILSEVVRVFSELQEAGSFVLVSGGADGVDLVAEGLAQVAGVKQIVHEPDYSRYEGREAPLKRNALIVRDADAMHAFPSPWSRGTHHAMKLMQKAGKPCHVHEAWKRDV